MFSRILILAMVLGLSSAFAGQKNSARLVIGVETCEAYPEDCVRTDGDDNFYNLVGTVKGYQLTVKAFRLVDSKKVGWTRRATIESSDAEVIAILVKQLEKTEIVRESFLAVCEIATRPSQYVNLLSTADENKKLRAVLGPMGCWVGDRIYPETNLEAAQQLKEILRPLIVKTAFTAQ